VTFVSYAQNFEDVLLWRALHDVKNGRYLDIGAHDPRIDSVSLAFYEAGWRGVNVEPIHDYAARLREARPDDEVIEAAVDDKPGPIPFYELSGLSSGRRDVAEHHARAGHQAREILVPTVRLENLLNLSKDEIHWLKIDVEGMEQRVLRSWGDSPKRPWVLVVEATFPNTQEPTDHLWIDEVLRRGYSKAHFDGLSCYFVHENHKELAARLTAPANVFDAFSITPTHFSAKPMREILDEKQRRAEELDAALAGKQAELESVSRERDVALDQLATAESEHRQALSAAMEHGRQSDRRAAEAEAAAHTTQVELARFQERSAQLQDKLDRASQVADWAEERAKRLGSELQRANEATRSAGNRLAEATGELAQIRLTWIRTQDERDNALANIETMRTEIETMRADSDRQIRELQVSAERLRAELSEQIQLNRADLARAGTLIRAVAAERSKGWHRIGEVLGLAGKDLAWRALSSWYIEAANRLERQQSTAHPAITSESNTKMNIPASIEARNPFLRANSLKELLSWNDVDFVRCAYVTILGRQPDPEGEGYYAERLRRGYSKMDVLWQLRRSREGPRHDPGIAGLDRALRRARVRSWPVRALKRVIGNTAPPTTRSATAAPYVRPMPAPSHEVGDISHPSASAQTSGAEIEALKGIMDGFAHALRGVANAQARHEEQIKALSSLTASLSRPPVPRRSKSK
jgi:FkbM family methyltransferase